jgi:hypothetical protein
MANISFSIDEELHKKMKEHPEIKWSEVVRNSIKDYLKKVEEIDTISVKELRERLPVETLEIIEDLNLEDEEINYKKAKEIEKERMEHLNELKKSIDE